VLLAACGSGDGSGTGPTIGASLPADGSIARPTASPGTDAAAEAQPAETQPAEPEEEAAPPATAPSSSVAAGDDDGDTVWWPWVLGGLVVIGVIALIAGRRRPRGPSWQMRTTQLLDEIDQLTNHLAAVSPDGLHAVAQSDAMSLATMRGTLTDLIASAPDGTTRMALNELTTPLAELHGAVDAIAMSPGPSSQLQGASVPQLATQLHTASASVRANPALYS
jgi:hypothetical protein